MQVHRLAVALVVAGLGVACAVTASQEQAGKAVPAPAVDEIVGTRTSEVAVLAGGCFWGVQGVYQHVKGVTSAISGYAGGEKGTAEYERVGTGRTGHAESVQITFDPRVITYGRILQIFFSVVHDPTQLNRQGPDTGTEYRSALFPVDREQERIARAFIAQLTQARTFAAPIVTTIEPDRAFYRAEDYHQDYLELNPASPYIAYVDMPKLQALERVYPQWYRAAPVLVRPGR